MSSEDISRNEQQEEELHEPERAVQGDFIERDKVVIGDEVHGDKVLGDKYEIKVLQQTSDKQKTPDAQHNQQEREMFSRLSLVEKRALISSITPTGLRKLEFHKLHPRESPRFYTYGGGYFVYPTFWKVSRSSLILIIVRGCQVSFSEFSKDNIEEYFYTSFAQTRDIPKRIANTTDSPILSFRRIWIVPFLTRLSDKYFPRQNPLWRSSEVKFHYYLPMLKARRRVKVSNYLPSSSEVLFINNVLSDVDYTDALFDNIQIIEEIASVIQPIT
jgi:hypothetical protein